MFPILGNNARSTLAAPGITAGAASLTVAAGEGARFPAVPANGFYWATLDDGTNVEVVLVTARASDAFTVTRGQQGTTGTAFGAGTAFEIRVTRDLLYMALYGAPIQRFEPGEYYGPYCPGQGTANTGSGSLRVAPFYLGTRQAFDRIACEVTTLGAGSVVRLGVYKDGGNGEPGDLLFEAGTVDSTTTGVKTIVISQTLDPGLYWLAALAEGATVGMRMWFSRSLYLPFPSSFSSTVYNGYQIAAATGSLPGTFGSVTANGNLSNTVPMVLLRAA